MSMRVNNKKYVYEHWLDGECFYVGYGGKRRPRRFNGDRVRSAEWWEHVGGKVDEIDVRIIKSFDREEDAVKFEYELTLKHREKGSPLVNILNGNRHVQKTKDKISEKLKGRPSTFKGRRHTEEWKRLMSEARSGENHHMWGMRQSDITKKKRSESLMGHKLSESTKKKIGKVHLGKIRSQEDKDKQSKSSVGKYRGIDSRTSYSVKVTGSDGNVSVYGSMREMERETGWSRSHIQRKIKENNGKYTNRKGVSFEIISKDEAYALGCRNTARDNGTPERLAS